MSDQENNEIIFTYDELNTYTNHTLYRDTRTIDECVDDWFHWLRKRGERYLKDAALKGHFEVTLDLPYEISTNMNKSLFQNILRKVKKMVPGCDVFIIEETNEDGELIYKVEINWR
jgi:hypothetical protein